MNAITTYINESLTELRHVRWPTRNQAVRLSVVVIAFTFACGILLGVLDFVLSEGLQYILNFA